MIGMQSNFLYTWFTLYRLCFLYLEIMEQKMRMRSKCRKSSAFYCNAGTRRPYLIILIWSLLALVVVTLVVNHRKEVSKNEVRLKKFPVMRELEEVEEESFHMPPPRGRRSPRAAKRTGNKKHSLIDEFLDDSSPLRRFFFPSHKNAVDPMMTKENDSLYYYPGRQWVDTDGNAIQAHGGGIIYVQQAGTYYWYGENKNGRTYQAHIKGAARVDIVGVSCYSSQDLWTWKHEGVVLAGEEEDVNHDLHKSNVLERPKVVYNDRTGKYVMWMHIDDVNYTRASVGVAVSDYPTGPFRYLYSKRPHGFDSRDMTVFKDDDDIAYLVYSSEDNSELHIGPLTKDYLDVTRIVRRILVGQHREAPAIFKHEGTYYMITSGCTGWAPNRAMAHAAESIMGPWETMGNPCTGGNRILRSTTFFSQSTFVLRLPGFPNLFLFMADRWNPADLRDSRYIWLPLIIGGAADEPLEYNFGFPLWSRVSVYWHRRWRLPDDWNRAYVS